jgi:hypothetical protein
MTSDPARQGGDESKGLRRIATGATIGLAAGIAGLAFPVALILVATYGRGFIVLPGPELVQVTAIMALAGALLFAISLLVYRLGFRALRAYEPRFWSASILCLVGTIGVLLIVVAIGLAFVSSNAMANCIQGAPTKALTCLQTAAPLSSYSGVVGAWLLWLGAAGVVVGIGLTGARYRGGWLFGGAALYSLLLLGLLAPIIGLFVPLSELTYPLLAAPALALLAPATVLEGCNQALGRR